MLHTITTSLRLWLLFSILTGILYPVLVTGLGRPPGQLAARSPGLQPDHLDGPEALIGTETHYRPSDSTTLHQRLVILPAVDGSGSYRVIFEGGLSVAVTTRLAMTATVTWNRNSDPGAGLKRNDTLLVTGLTFKFD